MLVRSGSRGSSVISVQKELKAAGLNPGPIDGDFGPKTRAAVMAYQRKHHLSIDGVVGSKTWSALTHDAFHPGKAPPKHAAPPKKPGHTAPERFIRRIVPSNDALSVVTFRVVAVAQSMSRLGRLLTIFMVSRLTVMTRCRSSSG